MQLILKIFCFYFFNYNKTKREIQLYVFLFSFYYNDMLHYPRNEISTPAATADPMTPDILDAMQ